MTTQNNATGYYKGFFKGWSKALGNKPTDVELATVHALGARPGKQALANAMMLRAEGATAAQIVMACGAPQLNKMREFVARKLVTRNMNVAPSEAGHTVYKIELAAKGKAAVEKAAAEPEADKPAKAKRKPATKRKPKAEPEAVTVTAEPAATEPAEQPQA